MKHLFFFTASCILLFSSACKPKGCTDALAINFDADAKKDDGSCLYDPSASLNITLNPLFDQTPLVLSNTYTLNDSVQMKIELFRLYFSASVNDQQTAVLFDPSINAQKSATINVNPENADDLVLELGLNNTLNATDPATVDQNSPLSSYENMWWGWANKYIYFKIEGKYDVNNSGSFAQNFVYHVGANDLSRVIAPSQIITLSEDQTTNASLNIEFKTIFDGLDLPNEDETHTLNNFVLAEKIADLLQASSTLTID